MAVVSKAAIRPVSRRMVKTYRCNEMKWIAAEKVRWSSGHQLTVISNHSLQNHFSFALIFEICTPLSEGLDSRITRDVGERSESRQYFGFLMFSGLDAICSTI